MRNIGAVASARRTLGPNKFEASGLHPLVSQVLQKFIPPYRCEGPITLLDVGCGDGQVTRKLATLPGITHVTGLDSREDLVRQASSVIQSQFFQQSWNGASIGFVHASATDAGLFRTLSNELQYLTCFTTLHWLKNPPHAQELAVINFARAMKLGGQIFIVHFLGLDDAFMKVEAEILQGHNVNFQKFPEAPYTPMFFHIPAANRLEQFKNLFHLAGLTVQEAQVAEDRFPIERSQFHRFLLEASMYVKHLPEASRMDHLVHWQEEMIRRGQAFVNGNAIEFKTIALLAVLRKNEFAPEEFYDYILQRCEDGAIRLSSIEQYF